MNAPHPASKRTLLKAKRYAYNRGANHQADDFAGFVGLKHSEGRKATLRQLWIDFTRAERGDSRAVNGRHRRDEEAAESIATTDTRPAEESHRLYLDAAVSRLGLLDRVVFLLGLQFGMEDDEIADVTGTSRATVATSRTLTCSMMKRKGEWK